MRVHKWPLYGRHSEDVRGRFLADLRRMPFSEAAVRWCNRLLHPAHARPRCVAISSSRPPRALYDIQCQAARLAEGAAAGATFHRWPTPSASPTTTRSGSSTGRGPVATGRGSTWDGSWPGAWRTCPCWRCASACGALRAMPGGRRKLAQAGSGATRTRRRSRTQRSVRRRCGGC
jgi:hypothetical protein